MTTYSVTTAYTTTSPTKTVNESRIRVGGVNSDASASNGGRNLRMKRYTTERMTMASALNIPTRPTGEQMNDRQHDRRMPNQPSATPGARTAPQPNQAVRAAHGAHPAAKNQPKVQQQQHGVVDKKSKDKKEDKK